MFVYKHAKTVEYVLDLFLRKTQASWVNNSRFTRIRNAIFSSYAL